VQNWEAKDAPDHGGSPGVGDGGSGEWGAKAALKGGQIKQACWVNLNEWDPGRVLNGSKATKKNRKKKGSFWGGGS